MKGEAKMMGLNRIKLISGLLILAAIALLFPIYQTPIWWVSLEAPQYPVEAFPSGVRILFHVNGVFNGCEMIEKEEIAEEEALDCVHEMDTINHYVGMYPIAAGGPIELTFSIWLMAILGVMLLAYIFTGSKARLAIMGIGFACIILWMGTTLYAENGLRFHNAGFLNNRVTVLGEEVEEDAHLDAGQAIIEALKASLAESTDETATPAENEDLSEKQGTLNYLESAFEEYQKRQPGEVQEWKGNASQLLAWHYRKSLGRYFNDPAQLDPMVAGMSRAANILFVALVAVMLLLTIMARKSRGIFNWLLIGVPITFPLLFLLEYATWLGWYGHNMSEMGAFTLKPFMPTVFGQGKVAQFTTNSYPDLGFWMMVLFSVLLVAAALLRRNQAIKESD